MKLRLSSIHFTNFLFVGLAIPIGFAFWQSAQSIVTFSTASRSAPMNSNSFASTSNDSENAQILPKARRKMISTTAGAVSKDAPAAAK